MLCINVRWKTNLCAKVLIFQGANPLFNVGSLSYLKDTIFQKEYDRFFDYCKNILSSESKTGNDF